MNSKARFVTTGELELALPKLKQVNPFFGTCFLAFKRLKLPIGATIPLVFAEVNRKFLAEYFRPVKAFDRYYHPFHSGNAGSGWVSPEYARTSLQRIVKNTFGKALLHPEASAQWGWAPDYVLQLHAHLRRGRLPAFELALWIFRERTWPAGTMPSDMVNAFFAEFGITSEEQGLLFDLDAPDRNDDWLGRTDMSEGEVLQVIGAPPGSSDIRVASLHSLSLKNVGPARSFRYEPAERLNILTGDNSLGKTFLFECAWWALTGEWIDRQALPNSYVGGRGEARIEFELGTGRYKHEKRSSRYNWDRQEWPVGAQLPQPGLALYARYDGSFAIWDPARTTSSPDGAMRSRGVTLSRDEVWNGKVSPFGRYERLCNGLLHDWIVWQTSSRYRVQWEALKQCLKHISPSEEQALEPGEPIRLPGDARDIPTVRLLYGEVPVLHASAGVQRALALSYVLVWAWHEHQTNSQLARRQPQRRIALLVDEVEAHLHPRWQRTIVPALERAVAELSGSADIQLHVATHSPMVLASAEVIFDRTRDALHHIDRVGRDVVLRQVPFVRLGRADRWLTSQVFGLGHARSLDAEDAITRAVKLQMDDDATADQVRATHRELVHLLANDDSFWPRWRFFALSKGVAE